MRDINRIQPTLDAIKELWLKNPDLRLCQLLWWVTDSNDPFYMEDNVIIEKCKKILNKEI